MTDKKDTLNKADKDTIIATVRELVDLIGIVGYEVELKTDRGEWYVVQIDLQDPGILIGKNGETINALQLILKMILYKKAGKWLPVVVNVNDYLERREESLQKFAYNVSQKVKFSHAPQEINNLSASERRIIHLVLKDHPDVVTESVDVQNGRKLIIKPKN